MMTRMVLAVDGDLLVSRTLDTSISSQKAEIAKVVEQIGPLLMKDMEFVITHGNAAQVGFMLLRGEVASHAIHGLPLDVCGSDTQGATGYLLQQAIHNYMQNSPDPKQVFSLITQVVVNGTDHAQPHSKRGIGPFYDRDKAQSYSGALGWDFVLVPGYGYRRAVPSLLPKRIIEADAVKRLLDRRSIVICAGGGGVPVTARQDGILVGAEVVVDKAYTTALLAREINADAILFVTVPEKLACFLRKPLDRKPVQLNVHQLQSLIQSDSDRDEDLCNKLVASESFLLEGGRSVYITSPEFLDGFPDNAGGICFLPEGQSSAPFSAAGQL